MKTRSGTAGTVVAGEVMALLPEPVRLGAAASGPHSYEASTVGPLLVPMTSAASGYVRP